MRRDSAVPERIHVLSSAVTAAWPSARAACLEVQSGIGHVAKYGSSTCSQLILRARARRAATAAAAAAATRSDPPKQRAKQRACLLLPRSHSARCCAPRGRAGGTGAARLSSGRAGASCDRPARAAPPKGLASQPAAASRRAAAVTRVLARWRARARGGGRGGRRRATLALRGGAGAAGRGSWARRGVPCRAGGFRRGALRGSPFQSRGRRWSPGPELAAPAR